MATRARHNDDSSAQNLSVIMSERRQLINLAYRLLGSVAEAEDAAQDTYARWYAMTPEQREAIESPGAWLTTVASRICLDLLGSARALLLTDAGVIAYKTVDPRTIPCTSYAGNASIRDGDGAYTFRVNVPTDVGIYEAYVTRSATSKPWQVERMTPPNEDRRYCRRHRGPPCADPWAGSLDLRTREPANAYAPSAAAMVALGNVPTTASVAGYMQDQLANAAAILNAATTMQLPAAAQTLGVQTAIGESSLNNLANGDEAISPDGSVADSIGLFQQQSSWGSTVQRMDPATAATLFYQRIETVAGWEQT
ncbi:sigma factor [Glaciihabitans sp. UYNi722]|uniref:sigma factor n=1 Tax=Glaciihabitans sp. UYNi722 TaxID=3156344 RepID=UPI003393D93A